MNVLGIVGFCYYCGYDGLPYPRYCRKAKGNPCYEAYKQGKEDKKKGICKMDNAVLERFRKRRLFF